MNTPQLIPTSILTSSPVVMIVGGVIAAYFLYRFVYRAFSKLITLGVLGLLGVAAYVVWWLHNAIAGWQKATLDSNPRVVHSHIAASTGLNPTSMMQSLHTPNLTAMSPLVHQNAWVIALMTVVAVLWVLSYLIYRAMSPTARANLMQRLRASETSDSNRKNSGEFPINEIELAVRKDNGQRITLGGKDRFLATGVLGSTGTGKTSRILLKAIIQDLKAIALGWFMDVIVLDPDGEFAQKVVRFAERLGIHTDIIDLRSEDDENGPTGDEDDFEDDDFLESTVSFNPFAGGNIADIIDNVRAALQEKMGKQEGYFQNAQDNLVRVVIQVQVPLWPETDFLQFADLVTDPIHFRSICSMVNEHATGRKLKLPTSNKKKKEDDSDDISAMWEYERPDIIARYDTLKKADQSMVLAAARSFLRDTRSEQKMEKLESVTDGLKIVVGELAYNPRLRKVFGTEGSPESLPVFDLKSFLNTRKSKPGRLMVVITGNQPAGKLFGKLFLVTLKMYTLRRKGKEDTRRPVYLYVDEFAVFGTESFTEMFSQARKYRVSMMLAWQARSMLLDVSKKFQDVVEGSCRNKIFFPSPSPDDAKFLEHALGSVTNIKETHSENKLSWLFFDNRNLDRKVSTTETIDPRFRVEDIAYGLSKDEAIFVITEDNDTKAPTVGITSYAEVWMKQQRGFFKVNKQEKAKLKLPKVDIKRRRHKAVDKLASTDETGRTANDQRNDAPIVPDAPVVVATPKPEQQDSNIFEPTVKSAEIISIAELLQRDKEKKRDLLVQTPHVTQSETDIQMTTITGNVSSTEDRPLPVEPVQAVDQSQSGTVQATRIDLRKRPTPSANVVTSIPDGHNQPLCNVCQKPTEFVKSEEKDAYVKKLYRCPEPHENKAGETIRLFCRNCGSLVKAIKRDTENQLVCPNCGVISSRKSKIKQ